MADGTKIEWTDATVNAVNGCSVLSPGCANCYAMRLAGTRMRTHPSREGLTISSKAGPVWNGQVRLWERALLEPLKWRKPHKIFWNAHGDLFHDAVPDEWIDRVFAVCALTPHHTHQILTKRSARMRRYLTTEHKRADVLDAASHLARDWKQNARAVWHAETWPLPNVWLGVSTEDQQRADERIPDLLATPAAVRWISAEPLLGPLELRALRLPATAPGEVRTLNSLTGRYERSIPLSVIAQSAAPLPKPGPRLNWVVVGGESGPGARPMHPDWARSLRDQCAAAGTAFLFKQWGNFVPAGHPAVPVPKSVLSMDHMVAAGRFPDGQIMVEVGKTAAGRMLDGVQHDGYPNV